MKVVALHDEQAIRTHALACADLLAAGEFERVGEEFGFALAFGRPRGDCIAEAIRRYRSERFYPGESEFRVSAWREARVGNPEPRSHLTWYQPGTSLPRGVFELDLPLNGKWSDLLAEFVLFDSTEQAGQCVMSLEDISAPSGGGSGVA